MSFLGNIFKSGDSAPETPVSTSANSNQQIEQTPAPTDQVAPEAPVQPEMPAQPESTVQFGAPQAEAPQDEAPVASESSVSPLDEASVLPAEGEVPTPGSEEVPPALPPQDPTMAA